MSIKLMEIFKQGYLFDLLDDSVLNGEILKHRLDDHIALLELGVVQHWNEIGLLALSFEPEKYWIN